MNIVLKSFKCLLSVNALLLLLVTNNTLLAATPPNLVEVDRIYETGNNITGAIHYFDNKDAAKDYDINENICRAGQDILVDCEFCGWADENDIGAAYYPAYRNTAGDWSIACSDQVRRVIQVVQIFNEVLNNGPTCDAGSEGTNSATGNNFQRASDIPSGGASSGIPFSRSFNSNGSRVTSTLGSNWQHNFSASIERSNSTADVPVVAAMAHRPDGRSFNYVPSGSSWTPDTDVKATLEEEKDVNGLTTGWIYTDENERVEHYNAEGKLVTILEKNGDIKTLAYNQDGRLDTVTNQYNRQLSFGYDVNGRLVLVTDPNGGEYQYGYDANGNLENVTNPDGTSKQYQYNDLDFPNALTASIDENGHQIATWTYDTQGRVIIRQRAGGQDQTTYTYNSDGTTTITDVDGTARTQSFYKINGVYKSRVISGDPCASCGGQNASTTYDANGFVASKTDFNGNVTTYVHNARGLEVSRTEASGTSQARTITTEWHSQYRVPVKITRPSVAAGKSAVTVIAYANTLYPLLPTNITRTGFAPDGAAIAERKISIQYSPEGRVSQIDGPRTDVADITSLSYYANTSLQGNNRGMLKTATNALGHVVTYNQYDAFGNVIEMTDANGLITTNTYDSRQRLVSTTVTPPLGTTRTTAYNYAAAGQLIKTLTPTGVELNYNYDAKKNLVSISDNLNNLIEYSYDEQGNRNQTVTKDPSGLFVRVVDYTHDEQDRINSINAAGSITQLVYDAVGNLVSQTDPNNNVPTSNHYDGLNRLASSIDSLSGVTQYDYDVNDRVVSVEAPNATNTIYSYDDLGNMLIEESPDRGLRNYQYNEAGNLVSLTDARDINVNYSYDPLGRIMAVDYPGTAEDVDFIYDAGGNCGSGVGRLCSMQDESGQTDYQYDVFSNILKQNHTEQGIVYTTQYSYDADNNVIQTIYPSGRVVNTARDVLRRVSNIDATVNGIQQSVVSGIAYRADNLVTAKTYGNGSHENRSYDLQGRLKEQGSTITDNGLPVGLTVALVPAIPSPSPSSAIIGFTAQPSDGGIYEYEFSLNGPGTGGLSQVTQAFSLSNTWNWNSTSNDKGTSVVSVKARIAGGSSSNVVTSSLNYTIGVGPAESVTLAASTVSPTVSGLPVLFTANALGGSGSYEYRFILQGPSTSNIPAVQQNYSTTNTFNWQPTSNDAGNYTITVDARNNGSIADSEAIASMGYALDPQTPATSLTVTPDLPSAQKVGIPITFTAVATGGNVGEYEYKFSRLGPDTNSTYVDQEYSANNTYILNTTEASVGGHNIYTYVRNKGSTVTHDLLKLTNYSIQTAIEPAASVTVSSIEPVTGTTGIPVTMTVQGQGGSVGNYEYRFSRYVPATGFSENTVYSTSNTYTFTETNPASIGEHKITVYVRNIGSTANYEAFLNTSYTVNPPVEPATGVTLLQTLPITVQASSTVNLNAQGVGGNVGSYEYRFERLGPDTPVVESTAYSTNNGYSFATTDASIGIHQVTVYVRNAGSTSAQEATLTFDVTVEVNTGKVIVGEPIIWIDLYRTLFDGNALVRNYNYNNWSVSAASSQFIAGDGHIELPVFDTDKNRMFGLNTANTNPSYSDINYAINPTDTGTLNVYENGTNIGEFGTYAPGDVLRVERIEATVVYKQNGNIIYTSQVPSTGVLIADTSLYTAGTEIRGAVIFGASSPESATSVTVAETLPLFQSAGGSVTLTAQGIGGNVGSYEYRFARLGPDTAVREETTYSTNNTYTFATTDASIGVHDLTVFVRSVGSTRDFDTLLVTKAYIHQASSGEPIIWTDLYRTLVDGNLLVRNYNYNNWSVSAASSQFIAGDGHIELPVFDTDKNRMFGLNTDNTTPYYSDINYAINPTNTGTLNVYENGIKIGAFGTYASGDVLRVERIEATVVYKQNGNIIYTSQVPSTGVLIADTSLYTAGTEIRGAVISGATLAFNSEQYKPSSIVARLEVKKVPPIIRSQVTNKFDTHLHHVNFSLAVADESVEQTQVMIVRSKLGEGYDYWLKDPSSNQQWQRLRNAVELGAMSPDTLVYVDKDYLDVWSRSEGDNAAYRYQRISAPINQQQKPARFIKTAVGAPSLATRSYSYDANGNVLDITSTEGIHGYGYDALNRIIDDAVPNKDNISLTYDANGNRIGDTKGLITNSYGYNVGSNQLNNVNGQVVNRDAAGNTTADISAVTSGARTFEYNNANRLYKVYEAGSLVATYTYNALGQRTRKVTPTSTTVYHYDLQGQLISETESDGRVIKDYVWQGIEPVAQIEVDGANESIIYLHTDHLATPRSGTDENGNEVWSWNSDAFGRTQAVGSATVNLRFPGQYYDSETQLHYNWNRYYDPRVGRYITSDPIGLDGGLNTFGYVLNNPLSYYDSYGLMPFPIPLGGISVILPSSGGCKPSEWLECQGLCSPNPVEGCYVTIKWKIGGMRNGNIIRQEVRIINCNCKDPKGCKIK